MALSGRPPTKAEKEWLDAICQLGCIVCVKDMETYSPASPHHIAGKIKPDAHFYTIPLCFPHHQGNKDTPVYTSRHYYKARFEARYGTERELLEATRKMVGENIPNYSDQ